MLIYTGVCRDTGVYLGKKLRISVMVVSFATPCGCIAFWNSIACNSPKHKFG